MAWTNPRTWVAGEVPTAAIFNTHVRDNFKAIGDAWTAYTPVLTAATTNPTIGNGSIAGAYIQVGKLVHFRATVTFGSTSTAGSGAYSISLPVAAVGANVACEGSTWMNQGASNNTGGLFIPTTTTVRPMQAAASVTHNSPFAWAPGDKISIAGCYEAA